MVMSLQRSVAAPALAFCVLALIGGTNTLAIRLSNRELPPFWGAGLRFGLTALLFLLLVFALRVPLPRGSDLVGAVIFGALGFGASYGLLYWGLGRTPAGLAQLLLASVPLLTFGLALAHGQERFHWRILFGGISALLGMAVISGSSVAASVPWLSQLAIVGTAACVAEATILARKFRQIHATAMNGIAMATGALLLFLLSAISGERPVLPSALTTQLALAYLVVPGSLVAFALYLFILSRWTASRTSYLFLMFPVSALALSGWLDNEQLTATLLVGGAFVLIGVWMGALVQPRAANDRYSSTDQARVSRSRGDHQGG